MTHRKLCGDYNFPKILSWQVWTAWMDSHLLPSLKIHTLLFLQAHVKRFSPGVSFECGRTWQPFVGGKNGHESFRQTRIYNFCDKCVVFARNRIFANLTEWNMQYIPWNSALPSCPRNTVFDPKRHFFLPNDFQKVRKLRHILKFSSEWIVTIFGEAPNIYLYRTQNVSPNVSLNLQNHQICHKVCPQIHHQIWCFTKIVTKFGDKLVT